MKPFILCAIYILSGTVIFGELAKDELERLQRTVKIDTIREETHRDETRNEFEVLKFNTSQYEMDKEGFYIRVTVEMKANGNRVYAQQMRRREKIKNTEYIGQDRWEFHIPHGEYTMPRITAYMIEYGIMDDEKFLPVAIERKNAKIADEIIKRCDSRIEDHVQLKHAYVYLDDAGENGNEEVESSMTILTK